MAKGKFTPFTKAQEAYIKQEYLNLPVKRLAADVNATYGRIMRFLKKHNLVIPPEIIEQRKRDSQRKKGSVPFNKGKKQTDYMTPEQIANSKQHRYKKGNLPHNTLHDGKIVERCDSSGRSYKYIRISKGVWELYQRVVWELAHGPIPEDHIVTFIDENSLNTNLDNLELITRSENMLRNSKHDYPEEIIPSMVLRKKLEDKINTLQDG